MQRGPGRPSRYPPEFRDEAVRLALSPEHTIDGVARDLGIMRMTLRNWIAQSVEQPPQLAPDERRELHELRRRVKTLETEREILKKAAADPTGRCNTMSDGGVSSGRWTDGTARQTGSVA